MMRAAPLIGLVMGAGIELLRMVLGGARWRRSRGFDGERGGL